MNIDWFYIFLQLFYSEIVRIVYVLIIICGGSVVCFWLLNLDFVIMSYNVNIFRELIFKCFVFYLRFLSGV